MFDGWQGTYTKGTQTTLSLNKKEQILIVNNYTAYHKNVLRQW
jgi:hypothetical protein